MGMKGLALVAATCATLGAAAAQAGDQGADAAVGRWRTGEDAGVVEVTKCGDGLCGAIVTSTRLKADPTQRDLRNKDPALRDRPIKGLAIFRDMAGGPSLWKGRIYNPVDGGLYAGSFQLVDADTVRLQGCLVWPLCKAQTWRRLR